MLLSKKRVVLYLIVELESSADARLLSWQLDPEQDLVDLPEMVQRFHSLFPLEDVNREDESPSTSFGVRTMIFKGISSSDGQAYAIRRIDGRQVITPENINLNSVGQLLCKPLGFICVIISAAKYSVCWAQYLAYYASLHQMSMSSSLMYMYSLLLVRNIVLKAVMSTWSRLLWKYSEARYVKNQYLVVHRCIVILLNGFLSDVPWGCLLNFIN